MTSRVLLKSWVESWRLKRPLFFNEPLTKSDHIYSQKEKKKQHQQTPNLLFSRRIIRDAVLEMFSYFLIGSSKHNSGRKGEKLRW